MAATGRDATSAPASEVASALREAGLVRLSSVASGDGLAATGVLARALSATGTAFQASVIEPFAGSARATEADVTVAVGHDDPAADVTVSGPGSASAMAFAIGSELGETPDPMLALAGTVAAGDLDERVAEAAEQTGYERRPGVAVPTATLADGLAHSTLVSGPFSGDVDGARESLAELGLEVDAEQGDLDEEARRRLASLVALSAGDEDAGERAANAIERALCPYDGGPFGTIGGYADVIDATARVRPGVGVALALGDGSVCDQALDGWRAHGRRAHEGVRSCETARYDGLVVARGDGMPVATAARLLADFRAPEPVVLAVSDGEAAVHVTSFEADGTAQRTEAQRTDDVAGALATAARAADGESAGTDSCTYARFDGNADDLIAAFREAR